MTDARRQTEPDDRGRQEQPGGYSRERHDTAQAQPSDGAPREVQRSERLSGYDRGRDPRGDGESGHGRGGRRTQSPPPLRRGSPGRQPGGSHERDRPHDSGREREAGHGAVQDRGGPQYQSPGKHGVRRQDERARGQQDVGPRAAGGSSLQWDLPRRLASGDVRSRDRSSTRGQQDWDRGRDGDGDSDRGRDRGLAQERGPDRSSEHLLERGRERRPDGAAERGSRSAASRNRSRSRDRDESPGRRGAGLQAEDRHGRGRGGGRSGSRGGAGDRGRDGRGQYADGANGDERRDRGRGGSLPSERDTRGYGRYGRSQDRDIERGRGPDRDTSRSPGRRSPGRRNELDGEVRRGPKHEDYESGEVRPRSEDRSRHDEQWHSDRLRDSPALHAGSDAAAVWAPRPVDELLPMRDRHDHGDVGGGGDDAGRSGGQDAAWQGWAPDGEPAPQREGRGPEGNTPALGHEGNAYRDYRHRTQQPGNRTVAAYEEHDGHEAPRAYAEGADIRRQWLTGPDGSGEVWPAGAQRPQGAGEAQVAARAGSGRHQQDWQRLHQQALLGSGDHGSAATQRQAPAIPPSGPSEPRRQHSNGMPPLPPPALEQLPGDHQQRGSRAPYMTHGAWTSSLTPLGSASAALSGRLANSGDSGSRQASMQAHVLPQLQDRSVARLPPLQPRAPSTGEPPVLQPGAPVVSQQPGRALSGLGQAAADRVGQLSNADAPACEFYMSMAAADENLTGHVPAQFPRRSRWGALPVPASGGEASAAAAAADGNAANVVPTGPSQAAGRTSDALPRASAAGQPFAVELAAAAAGASPPQQEVEAELGPPMPTGAPKHDVAKKFGRGRKGVAAAGSGTAAEQERQDGATNAAPAGDAGNAPAQAAARVATNRNGDPAAAATGGAAEAAGAAAASREEPAAPPQPTRPRPGARMRRSIAVAVDDNGDQFGADGDGDALLAGAVAAAQPSTAATVAPGAAESKSPAAPGSPVSPNKNWMAKVLQGKQAVATQASSPTAASAVSSGAGPPGWSLKLHPNTMQFSLAVPPSRINPLAAAPPPQQQPQQTEASTAATSRSPIHDRPFLAAAGGAGGPAAVPVVAQLPQQARGGGMHTAPQGPARAPLPLVPPSMVLPPTDDSPSQSPRARSPAPAPEHAPASMHEPVPGPVLPSAPVALHPVLLPQLSPQPGAGAATAPVAGRGGTAAAVRPSAGAAGDTDDDFEVEVVRECAAPPSAAGAFAAVGGTAAVATAMHMSLLRDDSACAEMSAALAGPGARAAAGPSRQTGVPPGSPLKEQPQLPTHLQARPTKQSLPQPAASQQSMPLLGAALQAPTALTGELPQQQLAAAVPLAAESRAAGAAAQAGPGAKVESSGCAASDSSAGGPLSLRQQAAEDRVHVAAVGGSKAAEVDLACREDTGAAAAGGTAGAGVAVDTSPAPAVAPPAMRASADVRAAAVAPAVSKQPTGTAAGDTADAVHAVVDSDGHQEQEMAARTLATGDPGVAPAGVPPGVAAAAGSPTARAPQGIPAVALQPEPQPAAGAADPGAAAHASHAVGALPAPPPTMHALHPRPDAAEPGVAPQGTRAAQTRKGGPRLDPAVRDALNGDAGQMPSTAHRRRSDEGSWSGGSSPSAAAGAGPASTSGTVAPAVGPAGRRARNGSDGTAPAMPPAATPLTSLPPKAKPDGKSNPAAQPKAAPPPAIGDAAAAATAPPATAGAGPNTSAGKRSRESGGCSGTGGPVGSVSAAATKAATKAANKRVRIEYSAGNAALAASVQPAPPALLPLLPLSAAVQPPLAPMTRSSSSQPVLKSSQQAPKDLAPGVVRAQRTAAAPVAAPVPQPSEPTPTSPSRQRKGVTRPPTEGLNRIFLDSIAQAVADGSTLRQSKTWSGPIHQRLGKGARAASASAAAAVSEPLGASVHTRITRSTAGAAAGPAAAIAGTASLQAPQADRLPGTATRTATGSAAAASASTARTVAAVRAAQQASAGALAAAEVGSTAAVRGAGQLAAAADDASTPAASAPAPSAAPAEPFPAKPLHTHEKRGLLIPASRLPGLPEHLQLQVVLDDVPLRDTVVAELTKAKSHAAASVPAYQIKPAELRSCNLMGCWLMRLDRQTAEAPQHVAASAGRDVVTLYMSSKEQHSASSAPAEGAGQSAAAAAAAETTGASAGGVGNARAGLEAAATAGPAAQATSTTTRGTPPAASNDARAARAARRAAATQSAASGGEARAGARALDPSEEHTAQGPLVPARDPAAAPPEVQAPTQQLQQTQQGPTTAAGVQGAAGHVALASDEAAASAAPVPDLAEAAAEAGTGLAARSATDAEVAGPAGACGPRTRSGSHAAAQLSGGAVALGGRAAGGSVGSGGHQSGVEAESPAQARVSASISPGPSARIVSGSPGAAATADGREATPGAAAKIGDLKFLDVEVQGFEPKKGSNSCEIQVYKNGVEIKHLKNIPTVDKAKSTTVRRVSCRHLEDFSDMWVQRWEASGLPRKKHVLKLFLSTSAPQQPQQPPHTEDAGADAGADAARDAAAPAEVPAAVPPEAMAAQPMATPAASCAGHEPAQRHTVAAEPPAQAMPAPQEELTAAPAPVKASGALASAAPVHPAGPSAAASLAAPAGSADVAAAWGSAGPYGQAAVQSRDVPVDASSAAATQTVGATTEGASRAPVPDQGPQPAALAQLEAEGYAEAQPPQLLRPEPEAEAHLPPQPQPQVVPVATQEPPGPVAHDGGNVEREAAAPGHRVVAAEALEHVEPAVGPTMPADAAAKADAHCAHAGVNMPRSVPVQAAAPEQEQLPAGPPASGGAAGEQAPDGLLAAAGAGGNAGVQPPGPTWPMEGVLEAAVHIKHNRKYLLLPANITEALPQSVSVTAVVDGTDVLDLPWRTLEVRPHDGAMHLYCGPEGPGPLNRMQLLAVVRTAHDRLELRLARPLVVRPSASRQDTAGSGPGARSPAATVATTALSQPLSGASGGATRAGTAKAAAAAGVMGQAVMEAAADPRSALQSNATAASQAAAAAAAPPPPPLPPPLLPATQVPTASPPNSTIARGGAGAGSRTAVAVAGIAAAGVRGAEVAGAAAIAVAGDGDMAGNSVAVLSGGGVPTQPIEARQEGPEEAGVPADAHGAAQLLETAAPEEDMAVSAEEQGSLRATARRRPTGEGANASASLSKQGVRTPAGAPATGAAALPSAAEAAAATQAATGAADDELLPRVPPSLRTTVSAAASGTGDDGYAPTHALASVAATPAPHVAVPGGAEAAEVTAVAAVPEAEAQAEAEVATANAGEGGAGAAAAAIPQQRSPASAAESNDSTPADGLPALRQRSVASRAVAVLGAERAAGLGSAGAGGHEATADALVAAGQWAAAGAAGQGGLDAAQPQAAGGARGACVAAAAPEDAVDDAAARDRAGNELVGILSNLARRQQWSNSRASGSGGCGDTELLVPVQRASPEQIQQMSQALSPARRSAAPPAAGWMELAPYVPPVPAPDVNAGAAVAAAGRQLASDDPGAGPPAKRPRMEAAAHAGGTRIFQLPEALFDESLMGPLHSMGLSLLMMTAFSAGPGTGAEDADSDAAAQDPESAATAAELRRLINEVMSQSRAGVAPYVAKLEFMQRLSTSLLPAAAAPGGLPKRTAYFVDQAFNANVMLALMAHPGLLDGVSANTGGSGAAGPGPAPPGGAGGAAGGGSPATGNPQGPVHDGPGGAGGSGAAGAGAGGAGPSGANPRGGGRGAGNTGVPRAGAQAQDARSQVLSPGVQTRRAMARDGGVLAAGAASSALPGSASASPGVLVPLPAVACPAAAPFVGAAAAVAAAALLGPAGAGPSGPPFADAGGPAALHPTRTDASGIMAPVSAPAQAVTAVAFAAPAPTTTAAASVAEAAPSTSARSAEAVAAGPATAAAAGAGPLGKPPPHPGSLPPLSHGARNGAGTLRRKQLAGTPSQSAACSDNSRGSSQGSPPEESPSTDALRQPLPPPPPQLHLPHPQLQQTQPHARVQPPSQPAAQLEPAPEGQSQPQPQQRQQRHEALHSGSPATGSRRVSPHVADQNAAAAEPSGPRTEVAGPRTRSAAAHEASRAADTNSSGRIGERTAEGGVSQRPRREHKPTKRYIQDDESDGEGEGWRRRPNRRVLLSDSDNQDGVEQQPRRGRDEEEEDSLRGRTTGDAAAALPPPPLPPPPGAAAQAERQTGRLAPAAAVVVAAAAGGRAAPVALVQPGEPGRLGAVARAAVPSVGWVIGLPPGALLPLTVWPNPVEAQGPPQDGRVAVEGGAVYPAFPAQELFYGNGQRWKAGGKLQIHHGMRVGHTDGKRPRLLCETDLALAKEPGQLDKLSVSKSCHACDATFIAAPCEWCGIVGFCSSCYETKLGVSGQMAYTEVMAKCLKCRRLCACKRCVDLPGFGRHKLPRLRTTLDMRQDMARHALRYLFGRGGSGAPGAAGPLLPQGGALGAYLHRERAALAQAGKALEDVKEVDMRKNRTVCDLCCTSIPAMYWCCTSAGCKKEFCLQCCAEGPAEAATTAGGEPAQPRCPWEGCRGHVQLHTFMRKPFHAVVLRAEQEFGPPAAATCAAGQRVAAAAAAPSVSQSFWSPHLVILSETVLRPELFGSAKQRETAQQQALAALRRLQAWKQRQSLQQQRQQAQQPQARDGAEHSIVIQACGSEVAAAELGIGLYRPGQAVPPGKVVAWGRYVLPEQDVRLAKPWWLPGMVNPQGHAPHIFSPLAADLQPSSPRFVPYCLIFQERWALRESVLVRECPMRGDLWCPEGIFRGVEEGIRRCKEQAVRQAMKQTEKKGPAVQAAAVAEAKRKWEGAEALKIINCADGFRQVNDMSGADFAKAFRKGFEPKRTEPAVKPAAEPAAKEFMGKLKDFPPSSDYFEVLPEQWEDFVVRGLPLQWMTRPDEAPLNLATQLPSNANPTDLGPKSYIAFGTPEEFDDGKGTERDSVTKLHQDMSDAVNILNFVQVNAEERDLYGLPKQSPEEVAMAAVDARRAQAGAGGTSRAGTTGAGGGDGRSKAAESQAAVFAAAYNEVEAAWREKMPPVRCGNQLPAADDPGYKLAGAEWVIWAPGEDTEALRRYLTAHVGEFQHQGEPIRPEQVDDPVFQQWFFLTRRHLQGLAREQEGRFWVFEQNEGEAVFIPGGCPHQVRNLRSCIKTAVDFVSPEAVDESLAMAAAFRKIPTRDPYAPNFQPYNDVYSDKLQGLLIAMSGAVEQFRTLYPGAYKAQASPVGRSAAALAPAAAGATAAAAGSAAAAAGTSSAGGSAGPTMSPKKPRAGNKPAVGLTAMAGGRTGGGRGGCAGGDGAGGRGGRGGRGRKRIRSTSASEEDEGEAEDGSDYGPRARTDSQHEDSTVRGGRPGSAGGRGGRGRGGRGRGRGRGSRPDGAEGGRGHGRGRGSGRGASGTGSTLAAAMTASSPRKSNRARSIANYNEDHYDEELERTVSAPSPKAATGRQGGRAARAEGAEGTARHAAANGQARDDDMDDEHVVDDDGDVDE